MKQLTAVSLFAGVGGFDLALERNGVKVVASVEIDKKASAILAKQFPNSKLFNDIKGVTGEQLIAAGFDPRNGIITGGFPCQDLSMAGKRAGLGGARSGLFWEICRLLDETRTQFFILENVPGLLSSNQGKDMATVLEALVERGYRVAFRVLDAQYFGVPQRRRRVFIVGSLGNTGIAPEQILAIAEGRSRYIEASKQKRENLAKKIATGINKSSRKDLVGTLLARDYKGVSSDAAGENKLVIVFSPHREDGARVNENVVNTLLSSMGTGGNNMPMVFPMHGAMIGAKDENGPDGSGFLGENDPSYTLTASNLNRHGVAIVFEPKSAFEENWAESTVKNTLRANASKSSHAIIHNPSSFADYSEQEIVGTLRAGMPTGSEPLVQAYKKNLAEKDEEQWMETNVSRNLSGYDNNHEARVTVLAETNSIVRRLTPVECERLQGFPDDWTSGQADQHRYKQMGNAVAVPVVEWIVKRLVGSIND